MLFLQSENASSPHLLIGGRSEIGFWIHKKQSSFVLLLYANKHQAFRKYQHLSFNTNMNTLSWLLCARVSDLCLWAVLWSTAGQTSEICKNILLFLTAPLISDNFSGWICTEGKLQDFGEYNYSYWPKLFFFFFSAVVLKCNLFLCRSSHKHFPPLLFELWKTRILVFFFKHNLLSNSVCIAYC